MEFARVAMLLGAMPSGLGWGIRGSTNYDTP